MKTVETKKGDVRKVSKFNDIQVSRVYKASYQKTGTLTAELKQKVENTSYYPKSSISDSLSDTIFSKEDFNLGETEQKSVEIRVAWVNVPEGSTVESVKAKIAELPAANIYKILSNHPIISEEQKRAIDSPDVLLTLDDIANRQVVRYPNSDSENSGKLILSNGKPQYMRRAFTTNPDFEDKDLKNSDPSDFYASDEIQRELNSQVDFVLQDQEIMS